MHRLGTAAYDLGRFKMAFLCEPVVETRFKSLKDVDIWLSPSEDHRLLHTRWTAEKHLLGDFHLTTISDDPPRVRAVGTVYWEARNIEVASTAI